RVIAIYEPRSATARRNVFEQEYINAFSLADLIFLPQAFDQNKIPEAQRFSSERVIKTLQQQNKQAFYCENVTETLSVLQQHVKSGDVILIMSNGAFGGIYESIKNLIKNV
ncbi:MAG: UDP-N-acetylmuramate:L-alanyl-gamma-D-glutamyl-meso-diaminopimelate ligase, partial [Bdellovibrionales bacterium]|nr:UDP-N-acetylmuramate:L-alanyl-gamma-D-glutamyl-meso-diaminopimelate ligase [Bdellovibrionales bacterium]